LNVIGEVCGHKLPEGLKNCSKLPTPIFTPSTKADYGAHDMNITVDRCRELLGEKRAREMEERSIAIYLAAAEYAASKGIILADTKMEWGVNKAGELVLVDEVLTPDSSRYWPADKYEAGRNQDSFDKQYVRNWLEEINFDKTTPIGIPDDVVAKTVEKYIECYVLLTGEQPKL
jgi:phosphoribosylaminoimidazole-succinocarboxamide synthase